MEGFLHVRLIDGTVIPATEASESTINSLLDCCTEYQDRLNKARQVGQRLEKSGGGEVIEI